MKMNKDTIALNEVFNNTSESRKVKLAHSKAVKKGKYRGAYADPSSGRYADIPEPDKSIHKILVNYKSSKLSLDLATEYIKEILNN